MQPYRTAPPVAPLSLLQRLIRLWARSFDLVVIGVLCALTIVFATLDFGCSPTTTQAIVQDISPAGACIANQLLAGGATDPVQILTACAGTTIEAIIAVVEQLLAVQPDAGGIPTPTQMRLAAVHTRALGMRVPK